MTTPLRLPLFASLWLTAFPALAGPLHFATAAFPPMVTVNADGSQSGPAVEILKTVARRLGQDDELTVLPLSRLIETAAKDPSYVVSISRTRERDEKFRWISCSSEDEIVLVSRAERPFPALGDLTADSVVGVMMGSSMDGLAQRRALAGALHVYSNELALELLAKGRLDGWLAFRSTANHLIRKTGRDPARFVVSPDIETIQFCIAMSPHAADADAEAVRRVTEELAKEGFYSKLHATSGTSPAPDDLAAKPE